jgi:hypothetical protein
LPPANTHSAQLNQARPSLDLAKCARIVGMLGSSHEGERANAVTLGSRMLAAVGMRWEDFIEAYRRAEIATKAAAILLAEKRLPKGQARPAPQYRWRGRARRRGKDLRYPRGSGVGP